jgi:hypothetical protein
MRTGLALYGAGVTRSQWPKDSWLGPKLVDWLRMFGGDVPSVSNDVYAIEGMSKLGLGDAGKTAAFIARLFGLSPYALDFAFRPSAT